VFPKETPPDPFAAHVEIRALAGAGTPGPSGTLTAAGLFGRSPSEFAVPPGGKRAGHPRLAPQSLSGIALLFAG
jgi:hypothetical protein